VSCMSSMRMMVTLGLTFLAVGEVEGGPVVVGEGAHTAHDRPGPQARSWPKGGWALGWVPCSRSVVFLDPLLQ